MAARVVLSGRPGLLDGGFRRRVLLPGAAGPVCGPDGRGAAGRADLQHGSRFRRELAVYPRRPFLLEAVAAVPHDVNSFCLFLWKNPCRQESIFTFTYLVALLRGNQHAFYPAAG